MPGFVLDALEQALHEQRPPQGGGHPSAPLWRSFEAVEYAKLAWFDWLNQRRRLEPIGNIPPAEAEEGYHAPLDAQKMTA